jgi:8-oxo-dGTP diphosphatase
MIKAMDRPKVGLGVIILNKKAQVLVEKRIGAHAPYWSIPGGHLELGETFERGAIRELKEEFNLDIENPKVIAVTNNLRTYRQEGLHYISIILVVKEFRGTPKIMEPDKCADFLWTDPLDLPKPHFDASELGISCYLKNLPYVGVSE